jgi:YfiH family protein
MGRMTAILVTLSSIRQTKRGSVQSMLETVTHAGGLVTYRSTLLAQVPVPHAFSTRIGGVSDVPFDTLNLAHIGSKATLVATDDPTRIDRNYELLLGALDCGGYARAWVHQTHGRAVARITASNVHVHEDADAMVSDCRRVALSVRVADCVPILIATSSGAVVAAVHAGWRGIVAGVIAATVAVFQDQYKAAPADLVAAVGPCISSAHFEVGEEVVQAFANVGLHAAVLRRTGDKPHVDLAAAAAHQLIAAGLARTVIDRTDHCTFRDAKLFFSHRRDAGNTGRMAAIIAVRQDG